jgi:hypothetical protein
MTARSQPPSFPYQPAGFPILNLKNAYNQFFEDMTTNTLSKSKHKEIVDDVKKTYLYNPVVNGKLEKRSEIFQDHMHTHPKGYITDTRLDLILETEEKLEKLDANSPLRKPTAKLLSYCKLTTKIVPSTR